MQLWFLAQLACRSEPAATPATTPSEPAATPATTPSEPAACASPVLVARSPFDHADPVEADPHEEVYGVLPSPFHLHLGLHADPARDIVVSWRTDAATRASLVRYGTDPDHLDREARGGSFLVEGAESRVHEVRLCDLEPGTTYHYQAGGRGAWSPVHRFTTAPAGPDAEVRIAVIGDSRDNWDTWGAVAAAVAELAPDVVFFTGDMVDVGADLAEWDTWFDEAAALLPEVVFLSAHGNHEFLALQYFQLFAFPGNEQWFSLDWGPVHAAFLNDTLAQSSDLDAQTGWLRDDMAATDRPWRVALHHQPGYTASRHAPRSDLAVAWGGVLEAYDDAIVFNGHNHNYERTRKLRGGVEDPHGTTYVVVGGAGAPLYAAGTAWYTEVSESIEHYGLLEAGPDRLHWTAWRLDGTVLDDVTLAEGPPTR